METHLYEDKGVCLDGFEELTEDIVDERYEILVRLVLGKRFLVGEDSLEQIQGGYLTRSLRTQACGSPHAQDARKILLTYLEK